MKYYTTSKISENIHETPEGFLLCVGVSISRTGEMVYGEDETPLEAGDDGQILINRVEEDVFNPKAMASFEGKSVTIAHPEDFVDPKNWKQLTVGIIQNVRRGEGEQKDDLVADLLITDDVAINLVKNGLREVSCGYEAEYTQTGEGRGIQTDIVGNHLALVDQGRAGSAYAINDHKGESKMSAKIFDKLRKSLGAKVVDAAIEEAKKDDAPAKDESAVSMDDVMKKIGDLASKIDALGKKDEPSKDADPEKKPEPKKEDAPAKDDDDEEEEGEASLSDRLKALETAVAKLSEKKADSADEEGDEEESEDDDFEESTMTGDTASRMEILAPGFKSTAKDAKFKALDTAYKTKDGKAAIDSINGGKAPAADAKNIDTLFLASSEILKVSRASELSKTKTRDALVGDSPATGVVTAEKLNEINAKFYGKK
jgi:uncharacterized protein